MGFIDTFWHNCPFDNIYNLDTPQNDDEFDVLL